MVAFRRFTFFFAALAVLSLLAACGGAPAAAEPTAAPAPTAKPTSTPRPTPKPKPTAEPTEEPTAEPEPTAAPSSTNLVDVEIGNLKPYTHAEKLFTIDVPADWKIKDNSKPGEAIVQWTDPAENAFMQVDIFESDKQDSAALAEMLKSYLDKTFGEQPDFSQDAAKESGPSQLIVWSYTGKGTNNIEAKLLGNSFIKQVGNKISLFTIVVPDEQFDRLESDLNNVLGSYEINDSVALNADTANTEVTINDLAPYSYKTGLFSIDVPSHWQETDNSKPGEAIVMWSDPSGRATIVADIFGKKEEQTQDQLVEFLKKFLTQTFGSEQDFTIEDPKPQSDGSVLLVWTYTDSTFKVKALGNSFIEQRGDKVSILSTVVPDEQFDQLLPKTNEVLGSYKIDATADLP
jgi:phenylpyruvate tautomerase PptA (4-oxalocrotonate tautomerase family)